MRWKLSQIQRGMATKNKCVGPQLKGPEVKLWALLTAWPYASPK